MKENKKTAEIITEVILLLLSIVLTAGVKTFISPCEHKTDSGMWMACHWAGQAVFGTGTALCANSLLMLILKGRERTGLALANITLAVVTAFIPNTLINLCMKSEMRCHSVMKPAVIVISIVIAVVSCVYIVINKNKE